MDPRVLYAYASAGDPSALAVVRSLTARMRARRATPGEAQVYSALVRLYQQNPASGGGGSGGSQDLDDATFAALSSSVARAAGRSMMTAQPQIGAGAGWGLWGGFGGYPQQRQQPCAYWTPYGWVVR